MERAILHCDLNNFYASVETVLHPELRGKPVAVCGSVEDRHGIVLAKSEPAKKCGVKTAETIWQAKRKCPDLIVLPPHFDVYVQYAKTVRQIYCRYTNQVEPFGLDECWLDVGGSERLFGAPHEIAFLIKETVKKETGLTVSVGVSFNKIFAKLGSDMKKPDAITVIGRENFREIIWPLPASDLLWVGKSTYSVLQRYGISTIGDVACAAPVLLKKLFGKNGVCLWQSANGLENSKVCDSAYKAPVKSIGRGITCVEDLQSNEEVWRVILTLSHTVSEHLRREELAASGVQISIKNTALFTTQAQEKLLFSTQNSWEIAAKAQRIFTGHYRWQTPVRAVTVRAIDLVPLNTPQQLSLGFDAVRHERLEALDKTVLALNQRYGRKTVLEATVLQGTKMPEAKTDEVFLPPTNMR